MVHHCLWSTELWRWTVTKIKAKTKRIILLERKMKSQQFIEAQHLLNKGNKLMSGSIALKILNTMQYKKVNTYKQQKP